MSFFLLLQVLNVAVIMIQTLFHYLPSDAGLYIMFGMVLWQGFVTGVSYTNTYSRMSEEVSTRTFYYIDPKRKSEQYLHCYIVNPAEAITINFKVSWRSPAKLHLSVHKTLPIKPFFIRAITAKKPTYLNRRLLSVESPTSPTHGVLLQLELQWGISWQLCIRRSHSIRVFSDSRFCLDFTIGAQHYVTDTKLMHRFCSLDYAGKLNRQPKAREFLNRWTSRFALTLLAVTSSCDLTDTKTHGFLGVRVALCYFRCFVHKLPMVKILGVLWNVLVKAF